MSEHNKLPEMVYSIEEFKALFHEFNIEEDKVRFYIGKYHLSPKAYGIYQIDENYIVYKNKSNGETFIRYKGPSEEEACKELYTKFLQEVSKRKNLSKQYNPYHDDNYSFVKKSNNVNNGKSKKIILFAIILIITINTGIIIYNRNNTSSKPQIRYYENNDRYYKKYNDDWYYWDDGLNDWYYYSPVENEYIYFNDITDSYYEEYEPNDSQSDDYNNSNNYEFDFSDSYQDFDSDW